MVYSILQGKQSSKTRFLRAPEILVRILVNIINIFIKFPLTISRVNALTNKCIYDSSKIENNLDFIYDTSLQARFIKFSSDA